MSDYEEEEYGYDEYGSGDEYEDGGYRDYEEQMAEFTFKDTARVGAGRKASICDNLTTVTEGKFGQQQRRYEMMYASSESRFITEFCRFLNSNPQLYFEDDEYRQMLESTIKKLPLIKYKNPKTYVLGYYLQIQMNPHIPSRALDTVSNFVGEDNVTMLEILKYARYWNLILLK